MALQREALGAGSVSHILESRRRHRGQVPPMLMILPDRPGVRDLTLTQHRVESYDDLSRPAPDDDPDR